MSTARESAVRLLKLTMFASLVLPAALFVYVSWGDYDYGYAVADERIDRSLDALQEQALKVFETVDRVFPEVDEVVRGMSHDQMRAAQSNLTPRIRGTASSAWAGRPRQAFQRQNRSKSANRSRKSR